MSSVGPVIHKGDVALYRQLARSIEESILSGDLTPDDRLESEAAMMRRHRLSRATVRKAIDEVEAKGLVARRHGIGTIVVRSSIVRPMELRSLHQDLLLAGRTPTTTVLKFEQIPCPAEVSQDCPELLKDEPVVHLRRLRLSDGEPIAILETWMRPDLVDFGPADLERSGLYDLIARSGHEFRTARQQITATIMGEEDAALLGEEPGSALMVMLRASFDPGERLLEFGIHVYPAKKHRFEAHIAVPGR